MRADRIAHLADPHFPHYADDMSTTPRRFIIAIGGYRTVARRLGKPASTVHGWTIAEDGRFPSRLYHAFCALADEAGVARPSVELFRFLGLPPASDDGAGA
jgi:hypothetical protein